MSEVQAALVWCTFPDVETARKISGEMLEEKLIACANILPAIEAVFVWDGKISSGDECAVLFKTTANLLDRLVECLGERHPYDTPAIIGWHCNAAHPETLLWLAGAVDDEENSIRPKA